MRKTDIREIGKIFQAGEIQSDLAPSFRNAFKKQRCLIVADGFYEWQGMGAGKKPFYIFLKDEKPFAMAGLYENWTNPEGKIITTCTIVTTEANEFMKPLYHRMPVIVRPEDYDLWLNPLETDFPKLQKVFSSIDSERMKAFEVSIQVNLLGNNSEDCIRPFRKEK